MRSLNIFLTLLLFACFSANAQTARLQVIHNSPTPTVDIYANGDLLLDNFVFRTATPFIDVPADVPIDLAIAGSNSTSAADAIANFPVQFESGKTYVTVAGGVVGGNPGFNLFVYDMGAETADASSNVGILFFHGSPDAPTVDVVTGGSVLIDDASFGDYAGYLNVPAAQYDIGITPGDDNNNVLAAYNLDLSWWAGNTAVIFASGFLSGENPGFEPWVALSNGGTFPLSAIPVVDNTAKVQIIHNSPTAAAGEVDIYVNDDLLLDHFAFRTATPFVEVPVGVEVNIGVALSTSTSSADAIANFPVTFEAGKRYIAVANGLVGEEPPFTIDIFDMGREQANNPGQFDVAVLHGSPNAPAVDLGVRGIGNVVNDISFGEFADYLSLNTGQYFLDVKPAGSNDVVATFDANITGLGGQSGIAIASGLLGGDPAFTIIVVLADGTVLELNTTELAQVQIIHNSPTPTVDLYVNGDLFYDNFVFRTATPFVSVPANVELNVGVALGNSTSADDILVNFPLTLDNAGRYVVVANGIVGSEPGFNLEVFSHSLISASNPDNVSLLFFHGSPDAPEVDVLANGGVAFDDVSFAEFSGYISVPASSYTLDVTPAADNQTVVASYSADFGFWAGRSAVVFASGFLSGENPGFEPWVALDNGGTFPLPLAPGADALGNPLSLINFGQTNTLSKMEVSPNPADAFVNITFETTSEKVLEFELVSMDGKSLRTVKETVFTGFNQIGFDVSELNNGMYFIQYVDNGMVKNNKIIVNHK